MTGVLTLSAHTTILSNPFVFLFFLGDLDILTNINQYS
jgi:hypothetical protein